jgi:hypothetical protein
VARDRFRSAEADEYRRAYDTVAHAFTIIQEQHRLVHDGMWFTKTDNAAAVANGASLDLLMVPDGVPPHLQGVLFQSARGGVSISLYEGVTTSDDGTLSPGQNRNRLSTRTPTCATYRNPTVTDLGTQVYSIFVPQATQAPRRVAISWDQDDALEWILDPAQKYLVRVQNNSGNAMTMSTLIDWYEATYEV